MKKYHYKLLLGGFVLTFLAQSLLYSQGQEAASPQMEYSMLEYRALRYEMIEKDIYLRTVASMISLNRLDKVKEWVEKLSRSATSESPMYKQSIAAVYRKWKKASVSVYEEKTESEALAMLKYIEKTEASGALPQWEEITRYYNGILDNCRGCHIALSVKKP